MSYGDPTTPNAHPWALNDNDAQPFFRQAVELGVTFWDTANVYQQGTSEELVGRAITRYSRRDYIDLYQIHRFDPATPVEETMAALHDIVKAGKVRYIGASSMYAWQFAKMQHIAERHGWTKFVSMQNHYNLLYREEEREMIPQCIDQGVG